MITVSNGDTEQLVKLLRDYISRIEVRNLTDYNRRRIAKLLLTKIVTKWKSITTD